jgi:metal-responsive CopG/Arc/MetJ family transcriptional regulator
MKTAVSLPDELFAEAEEYAECHHVSRSALYARAIREYLTRHNDDAITAAINSVADEIATALEPDLADVSRERLRRQEW